MIKDNINKLGVNGLAQLKPFVKRGQIHTGNECHKTFFYYLVWQSVNTLIGVVVLAPPWNFFLQVGKIMFTVCIIQWIIIYIEDPISTKVPVMQKAPQKNNRKTKG